MIHAVHMALRSSSSTYVLAIDLFCGGCFVLSCQLIFMCVGTFMCTEAAVISLYSATCTYWHVLFISVSPALWGCYSCYMCSSNIPYMLTAACCGCIGSSKSQCLLCCSSRSVPPRPNTLTLSCILPCKSLRELS